MATFDLTVIVHRPVSEDVLIFSLDFSRNLLTNRGLIEVADRLYFNPKTRRPKRGAASDDRPGNLRRLIAVAQQLEFNYDLYGMNADEILELLPGEFAGWKGSLLHVQRRFE